MIEIVTADLAMRAVRQAVEETVAELPALIADDLEQLAATAPEAVSTNAYDAGFAKGRKDGIILAARRVREWPTAQPDVPTIAEELVQHH